MSESPPQSPATVAAAAVLDRFARLVQQELQLIEVIATNQDEDAFVAED